MTDRAGWPSSPSSSDGLTEHPPGDLAAGLLLDASADEVQLTGRLADCFYRRHAEAAQGLEPGWMAAAAAWACHLRALAPYPPLSVLALSLQRAGDLDEATADLVADTSLRVADVLDRLQSPHRQRADLVEQPVRRLRERGHIAGEGRHGVPVLDQVGPLAVRALQPVEDVGDPQ
jgi:hypothetical protein